VARREAEQLRKELERGLAQQLQVRVRARVRVRVKP